MPLTPEDVATKVFTSTRLKPGYDETEVDEFLDEVEAELTRLYRENEDLRTKLSAAQRALQAAGQGGATAPPVEAPPPAPVAPPPQPQQAAPAVQAPPAPAAAPAEHAAGILALAQRTADEHVAEARQQAERIVTEARSRAEQMRREAEERQRQALGTLEQERGTLERRVEELRAFEREYRTRLKSYIEGQLRELEGRDSEAPGRGMSAAQPANSSGGLGRSTLGGQPSSASASAAAGQPMGAGQRPANPFSSSVGNEGQPTQAISLEEGAEHR